MVHAWSDPSSLVTIPVGLVAVCLIRPEKSFPIGPIPYRNALRRFSVAAILVLFGILAILPGAPDSLDWVFSSYGCFVAVLIRTETRFGKGKG